MEPNKNFSNTQSDIVLSTRIRLARNLADYPFPVKLPPEGRRDVVEKVSNGLKDIPGLDLKLIDMGSLSDYEAVSLAERHLISPEFAGIRDGRALLLSKDGNISIMLCEEDHIRIQVIYPALVLEEAYGEASRIDDIFDEKLKIAFDERIGYLTQCPTNLGTGMRASVLLHLPALSKCGQISRLANTVSKLGLTIRGSYGEGTGVNGDIYQLSNQITLGISEKAALNNLKSITMQLATQERAAREDLIKKIEVTDKIHRSLGILQNARTINTDELMELLSWVRLGAVAGEINIEPDILTKLFVDLQPATINASIGMAADMNKRDIIRADMVRKALS
ncbi:MAG: protein arginine kinase [Oscillospiraceae bacterium]|nr:protein arginine kinase [Oscillospiraceae bacterium]